MKFTGDGIPQIEPLSPEQGAMLPFVVQAWSRVEALLCDEALRQVVWQVVANPTALGALSGWHRNGWLDKPVRELLYLVKVGAGGNRTLPFLEALDEQLHELFQDSELFGRALEHFKPGTSPHSPSPEWRQVLGVVQAAAMHQVLERVLNTSIRGWFYETDEPDGFFSYRPLDADWPMCKSEIWGIAEKRRRLSLQHVDLAPGLVASIRAFRRGDGEFDTDWHALDLDGMVRNAQGRSCAYVDAVLFEPPCPGCDLDDFFETADIFTQVQADMAHDMRQLQPVGLRDALVQGHAVLHIERCEVERSLRGRGLGAQLLEALVKRARRLARRRVFVVVSVHPAQFPRLDYSKLDAELRSSYVKAVKRLTDYLQEARGGQLFPSSEHERTWICRNGTYVRDDIEGLALLGQQMLESGRGFPE
jgi:predicted GNAT family acetyltransferase